MGNFDLKLSARDLGLLEYNPVKHYGDQLMAMAMSNYRPPEYHPPQYSKYDLMPKQIIHNRDAVIVFWKDGSKTIVRRREGDPDDIHSAFAQALTKKLFGATTTVHKMVDKVLKEQEPKKGKEG